MHVRKHQYKLTHTHVHICTYQTEQSARLVVGQVSCTFWSHFINHHHFKM